MALRIRALQKPKDGPLELARQVPDEPRWVDVRGLLLSGRCAIFPPGGGRRGFAARAWDHPFAAVWGRPAASALRRVVEPVGEGFHLLSGEGDAGWVASVLSGWSCEPVLFYRRPPAPPAAPVMEAGGEVLIFEDRLPQAGPGTLGGLPGELRRELGVALATSRPQAAAVVEGHWAAFCYAPFETETLWDVAVETLEPYRRRGLAGACFRALAGYLEARGKTPVWAAVESNVASRRLAAKLGFSPAGRAVVFVPPGGRSAG